MNRLTLNLAVLLCFCSLVGGASVASAISLSFSSEPNSYLEFGVANTIAFQDEVAKSFNDIRITASDTVSGSSIGLTGDIDGVFTVGAVAVAGSMESASLSGIGLLSISDGLGGALTGDVAFGSIATFFNFGAFNITSSVNLMNLSYSGTNADLIDLATSSNGVVQASFTAPIGASLSTLVGSGAQVGNYSGTIDAASAPVPEPSAALSFALGSLLVSQVCRRRR
jgi:hypothetical protein